MEDNIVRYTLFVLASVVGISRGTNEIVVFAFAFVLVFIVCMPQDRNALCLFLLRFLSLLSFACCVFAQFLC